MKSVDAIQEVQFLPGQRLATSPVAKLVGRRRQRSEAGRSESIGSILSLESCLKVVVPYGRSSGGLPDLLCANADSFIVLERSILPSVKVSRARDHRGRRPGHVDTRIARELGRASSPPVQKTADQCGGSTSAGVHRVTKAPCRKGPRLRRVDPYQKMWRRQVPGDERAPRRNLGWALGSLSNP